MVSKKSRTEVREKKHSRMRNHLAGTAERPRLAVFRSNNHMYAQIIDDTVGNTLVSASTLDKDIKAELEKTNNVDAAAKLGTVIAKKALDKGISTVVFDRGGFIYAGKVKALAEAAREAGLDLSLILICMNAMAEKIYTCLVHPDANKTMIKEAVERMFEGTTVSYTHLDVYKRQTKVWAHRGASGYAPENTLEAFKKAETVSYTHLKTPAMHCKISL